MPIQNLKLDALPFLLLMIVSAQFELSGCLAFWRWIHDHRTPWLSIAGLAAFAIYGGLQAIQPKDFGRSYSAYGAIFICSALLWGRAQREIELDIGDGIGVALCLAGALVIKCWPGH